MKVNANSFIQAWKKFIEFKYPNNNLGFRKMLNDWNSNSTWTEAIIGHNEKLSTGSPLGDYLIFHYGKAINYFSEFFKIDLILTRHNSISFKDFNQKVKRPEMFWPERLEILIEHENNIDSCWEEMTKLTYFDANLKVLISYIPDNLSDQDSAKMIKTTEDNFQNIITASTNPGNVNSNQEYLLILGRLNSGNTKKEITWHYRIFKTG